MEAYTTALALVGLAVIGLAWLPMAMRGLPLSQPIVWVAVGYVTFSVAGDRFGVDPIARSHFAEHLTELAVIISLMGAGLKLDRPLGWRRWMITWRLLAVTMPLCIAAFALLGGTALGLSVASAVLLGAVLAPTDPVLAADVQVGPPMSGREDETRFALTSEAGLNDGLAFPFTHLAVAIALAGPAPSGWAAEWLAVDVVWRIGAGVAMGVVIGRLFGVLAFRLPQRLRLAQTQEGIAALGMTLAAYGLTELVHGYGFLAVFVAALVLRRVERAHAYHGELHAFAEQTERLAMLAVLLLFGGAIAGGLLAPLQPLDVAAGLLFLFVVRPVAGLAGLIDLDVPPRDRLVVAFFGIRGIGSFYYLAWASNAASFGELERLWALVGFVVLVSILVHGVTATPVMRRIAGDQDRRSGGEDRRRAT